MNIRKIIHFIFYTLLLCFLCRQIIAQYPDDQVIGQLNAYFNEMYGLDQKLIKGIQYYDKYPRSLGNEFLNTEVFTKGRLVINNIEYQDLEIRYDIFNQQIHLHFYYDPSTANTSILNRNEIEEFELNGMVFRKYFFPETDTSFFQVIAEGRITCLYFWYKSLSQQTSAKYLFEFSDPRKKSFLLIDSMLYRYGGERTFLKLFPDYKSELRKYIRQNDIRLRKISDSMMRKLIEYCDLLTISVSEE